MSQVNWASDFFNKVTSRLPDLLTKHGEGKEMVAFDELRAELGAEADKAKQERAKELQAELDALNGKAPAPTPPAPAPELALPGEGAAEAKADPKKR